jgi:hypothetical protein|tara:strand:- start:241 stop:1176 length:936 start_codon:yes stop_codon:yes gene_type:complete
MKGTLSVHGITTPFYVVIALMMLIMGCSSGSTVNSVKTVEESTDETTSVVVNVTETAEAVTVVPTTSSIKKDKVVVLPTATVVPVKEATTPTKVVEPTSVPPTQLPVSVSSTPDSAKSDPSPIPPTIPTPTAVSVPTKVASPTPEIKKENVPLDAARSISPDGLYDRHGFSINTSGASDILEVSRNFTVPSKQHGMIIFTNQTSRVLLEWADRSGKSDLEFLADSYRDIKDVSPELDFSDVGEGIITVDSNDGIFGSFLAGKRGQDPEGYGLIGVWGCGGERIFALVVTGSDATVLQIRFHDLIDSFRCGT